MNLITKIVDMPELTIDIIIYQDLNFIEACVKDTYNSQICSYTLTNDELELYFTNGMTLMITNIDHDHILYNDYHNSLQIYNELIYRIAVSQIEDGIINLCKCTFKEYYDDN